ncbi:MAG: FtsQ-type POTRA domain-containing protein [Betaproteobacteria bacterium]|nr:FtsQ-type POTRA domain-containing protein [Betaproteobacteria bacterium]
MTQTPLDVRLMNALTVVLMTLFVSAVLTLVMMWLLRQPVFSLTVIRIDNELQHNNAVTLRANVAPTLSGNFFSVDLAQAKAAFESIPWVRLAVVRREFPDRLRVRIEEHEAVAVWGSEEEVRLVNRQGEIFEVNQGDIEVEKLPRLMGPPAQSAQVLEAYRQLSPVFERLDDVLAQLELSSRGGWRARLESGALIEIGPGPLQDIVPRVERFVATVVPAASRFGRVIQSADLRYPNGYALRLYGVSTGGSDLANKTTR